MRGKGSEAKAAAAAAVRPGAERVAGHEALAVVELKAAPEVKVVREVVVGVVERVEEGARAELVVRAGPGGKAGLAARAGHGAGVSVVGGVTEGETRAKQVPVTHQPTLICYKD